MKSPVKKKPNTYAKAGVDINKEERTIKGIRSWVCKTFNFRAGRVGSVMCDIGSFANLIDLGDKALAFCVDGVGSKVLVAQELDKYDTVGIDCVAMNVNDLICLGAEPISMVDYLALERTNDIMAKDISKGLYEGAKLADISIVGGETASLPEIITGIDGKGFDLAAAVIGLVDKDKIITGEKIAVDDAVLCLKSSGIHSNGLTLARRVLPKNMWMNLLTPTRIYVKEILTLVKEFEINGIANITGGGLLNLFRLTEFGYFIDNLPEPQMLFKKIQELGEVTEEEMYRTFNMGVGMCVITSQKNADKILEKYGQDYKITQIGKIIEKPGIFIEKKDREFTIPRRMY